MAVVPGNRFPRAVLIACGLALSSWIVVPAASRDWPDLPPPEIDATLDFTDKAWKVQSPGALYPDGEVRMFLQYSDDPAAGALATRSTIQTHSGGGEPRAAAVDTLRIRGPAVDGILTKDRAPREFRATRDLRVSEGRLVGQILEADPPESIACFDAAGSFAGWGEPTSEPGAWRLPRGRGPLYLEIRWPDGSRLRQATTRAYPHQR